MSKFNLEDWVWYATTEYQKRRVMCPDCAGTRFLTVIMGDGAQVTIDCSLCSVGYDPPHGFVTQGYYTPAVKHSTVEGVERDREDGFKYRLHDCYSKPEADLFATREEAEARAAVLAQELIQQEADRIKRREKDTRTWAWNARYHRECIRRAEHDLQYHRAKLEVAKVKAKEKVA